MATVKPIPDGYHTLTPYLIVRGGKAALEFYKKAFGATEVLRLDMPDGSLAHAEMKIGDSIFMMGEENEQYKCPSPLKLGGTPLGLMIYVKDADAAYNQAIAAGATVMRPIKNQFYGDRSGTVTDPFGHQWTVATHVEDVPHEELMQRMMKECG
ncbi:MAG TPA: VOC family protein [Planctomycetaceae bacterium]|nr:VOC family protein [Planctomycetaceae bacterium]